jgi:RHS repeat-associated protein
MGNAQTASWPPGRHDPRGTVVEYANGAPSTGLGMAGGRRKEPRVDWQLVDAVREYENYYEYDPAGEPGLLLCHGHGSNRVATPSGASGESRRAGFERAGCDAAPLAPVAPLRRIKGAHNRALLRHGETDADNSACEHGEQTSRDPEYPERGVPPCRERRAGCDVRGGFMDVEADEQSGGAPSSLCSPFPDLATSARPTHRWSLPLPTDDLSAARPTAAPATGLHVIWDSITVLQEKTSDGTVTDRQVHGYAPILSVGDTALMGKSGTVYVPTADEMGTIWNLLGASADKADTYTYDAFGVNLDATEAASNQYRFGTKRLGTDSGLYHFIARQYYPETGRFTSRDPVSSPAYRPGMPALIAAAGSFTVGALLQSLVLRGDLESDIMRHRRRYYISPPGTFVGRDAKRCRTFATLYAYVGATPLSAVDPMGLETRCSSWYLGAVFASCEGALLDDRELGICPNADCYAIRSCWDTDAKRAKCKDDGKEDGLPPGWWTERKRYTVSVVDGSNGIGYFCYRLHIPLVIPLPYDNAVVGPDLVAYCFWQPVDRARADFEARAKCQAGLSQ